MILRFMSTAALLTALGSAPAVIAAGSGVSGALQETKTKLFDVLDKDSVTVDFKDASATLDQGEIDDLKALLASTKRQGKIDRVIVATWADKDYPAGKGEKLGDADRKLADLRSAAVKKALTTLGAATVDTYTMAEHPSWFSKAFNTDDAKVKGEGSVKDADDNLASEIGKKLKDKGGPSKAVVIVRREGDFTTK